MKQPQKMTAKDRQLAAHQVVEASKKPYLVQNMPKTVLFLTPEQASKRTDLIPQFRLPECGSI